MNGAVGANLNDVVLRAIEVYNRYRSPEATAKLVGKKRMASSSSLRGHSARAAA